MSQRGMLLFWYLLLGTAGLLINLGGCGGTSRGSNPPPPKIQHVVVIFQENRTPDNLFQDPVLIGRGADIASSGLNSQGQQITLTPVALANDYDLGHGHDAFLSMYDNGKMDGADKIPVTCNPNAMNCPLTNAQFAYVNPSDVAPYFQLAEQYTFGDRMFQTNQGPSFPAHQFLISGTSAPTATSDSFVAENPGYPPNSPKNTDTGCIAPQGETVKLIDPMGDESQKIYPCFDHQTLIDSLDAKAISWRYYAPSAGSIWTAPNAIQHLCVPDSQQTSCKRISTCLLLVMPTREPMTFPIASITTKLRSPYRQSPQSLTPITSSTTSARVETLTTIDGD